MQLIEWDESIKLEIAEIDAQHQKLVEIINRFFSAMSRAEGFQVLSEILTELADYGVYHFQTEEKYFAEFDYEFTAEHKREHQAFVAKIQELQSAFRSGRIKAEGSDKILSVELFTFLKSWLINHIKIEDQKYRDLFKENGLT
ncbi:MAG: bacteriohemerythrin [Candidatus Cloacimonadales bacterium]